MILGELIKKYIDEHSMSYEEFGKTCGISKGYVSMLINNRNPKTGKPPVPKIKTYMAIAQSMNMTLDDLFRLIDDAPVQISDETEIEMNPQGSENKIRKWKMLSAGILTLTDDEIDRVYNVYHAMYPDRFPEDDERIDD